MMRHLLRGLRMMIVMTLLFGFAYTFVLTGAGQAFFKAKANGSLSKDANGQVVGSTLIAQNFTSTGYFHPRPSAAGDGYDGSASGGSQLGPTNPELSSTVESSVASYRQENGIDESVPVPEDAVTSSGSGLDPDISVANAQLQAPRVARARGVDISKVNEILQKVQAPRTLGFMGEPRVNVFALNQALDSAGFPPAPPPPPSS